MSTEPQFPVSEVMHASIRAAIQERGTSFRTFDISQDPDVRAAHALFSGTRNYNATIGRYLRKNEHTLGIRLSDAAQHPRGALWARLEQP